MTNLSPAAQALFDTVCIHWETYPIKDHQSCIAYVLRAAADQVVPLGYEDVWTDGRMLQYEKQDPVRKKLLAIAAELES